MDKDQLIEFLQKENTIASMHLGHVLERVFSLSASNEEKLVLLIRIGAIMISHLKGSLEVAGDKELGESYVKAVLEEVKNFEAFRDGKGR